MEHNGWADERFGAVADAFARNFTESGELGASVAVFVDGRQVVDLWGGIADERTGRAWDEHTVVPVFSCAKGVVSVCVHLLAQEGRLTSTPRSPCTGRSSPMAARRRSRRA